ncbi:MULTISPECIES: lectin-like domain-containing protein [unclassified Enterococcus]|uniref:lectin-like domain-containing protein n=1 Tax=unclassified Enterococcus TaxID=2608891 RepID=UPI001A9AB93D|nr:hypothetical protein [Enterococcus sp. DIV1271a]MBO1301282.1 hypothetical protein [Enterococcus sp. DIV1271a]
MEILKNQKRISRLFCTSLVLFFLFIFGGVYSPTFADTEQSYSTKPLAQNEEVALYLEETTKGIQFRVEKSVPETLQFEVTLLDEKGTRMPLFVGEAPLSEKQLLTEDQVASLYFTKTAEPLRLFIKYKTIDQSFKDLTPQEGQLFQLAQQEADTESNDTETDQTETTSSSTQESKPTEESQVNEESQTAVSESQAEEEQPETSSERQSFARAALARATGTGSQYVPPGAIPISGAFAAPNGGAVVSNVTNTNDNGGKPFSQISLSGSNNWTSIWSNDAYRLDFTKSFSQRVYVNFGTQQADGVAFVMHNDARKTTALTSSRAVGVDGQNLGVYGATGGYYELLAQRTPETTAIKNSVAVEFDMYANDAVTGRTRYDAQIPAGSTPHMAYTFPGNLSRTYQPVNGVNADLGPNDWFTLTIANSGRIKHNSLIPLNGAVSTNVQDGTWYEFNYNFDSTTRNFTYSFRNPVNGTKTADTTIPWADLNSELQLSANNNRAYWGFTAANGAVSGQVRFAFTQPPIPIGASVTSQVLDSANNSVTVPSTDTSKSKYLISEQPAKIQSTIKVSAGEAALNATRWTTVLDAKAINLATNASLTPTITKTTAAGVTTTIAPANLSTVVTNNATTGVINVVTTIANNAINLNPGDSATLSYSAPTKTLSADVLTSYGGAVLANPVGTTPNDTTNVTYYGDTVYYWVRKTDQFTSLSWENVNTVTNFSETLDISSNRDPGYKKTFYWKDLDTGDKLSFKVRKGTSYLTDVPIADVTTNGSTGFNANTQLTIPTKYFDYGDNRFVIEVYSSGKLTKPEEPAASLNLTVTYTGELRLDKVPTNLKWTSRTVRQSKGILARDAGNQMDLKVWDSRDPRTTKDWSIGLSIVSGTNAPFSFVWKTSPTSEAQKLSTSPIKVFDSRGVAPSGYEYTMSMDENTGILLNSPNLLSVGDYSGRATANWKLYNTATIE